MNSLKVHGFLGEYINDENLIDFYMKMQICKKCSLGSIDVNYLGEEEFSGKLPGFGNANSKILFIAQQPSYFRKGFEVLGTPILKSRTDTCFKEGLKAAGIKRNKIFVTNLVKCSSLKNEPMDDKIIETCTKNWLNKELKLLKPKYIVAVGRIAADFLGALRNRFRKFGEYKITTIRHPSYVVRGGMTLGKYKEEFIKLRELIDEQESS